jgi:hypothetical protein
MTNGNGNSKAETKGKNKGNGHQSEDEYDPKKAAAERKYKPLNEEEQKFIAEEFLFGEAITNEEKRHIISSDVPLRMVPLLAMQATQEVATDLDRVDSLSKIWRMNYLLYRKPLERNARNDALALGQQQQEQDALKNALKD